MSLWLPCGLLSCAEPISVTCNLLRVQHWAKGIDEFLVVNS